MSGQLLTIVPREHEPGTPVMTKGTKVLTQDGTEITGITKITLVADVNDDIWRAVIECHVDMQPMEGIEGEIKSQGVAEIERPHPPADRFTGGRQICPKCLSLEKRAWFGLGKALGCTNPECDRYYHRVEAAEFLAKEIARISYRVEHRRP